MHHHPTPQQCLETLCQSWTDGGAQEWVQQSLGDWDVRELGCGYCTVAAVVHAQLQPPTGQAYAEAKDSLQLQQRYLNFDRREVDESWLRHHWRRIRRFFKKPVFDPAHGTPSHTTQRVLIPMGYQVIYPSEDDEWHCICDPRCLYVLDVMLPDDGETMTGHTMTVHDGTAYTTAPFDPPDTRVLNVFRLPSTETKQLVAYRKYKEAHQEWHDNMEQNIWNRVPVPKRGDYVD